MKMKLIKKIYKSVSTFINKIVLIPISKLVFKISNFFEKNRHFFDNWLSKNNTLLFISLIISVIFFIVIDQKIINYSESSAEVLQAQSILVEYDEDNYVVEGIPESVDITLIGSKADLYIAKQSSNSTVKIDLWGLKPGTHKVDIESVQSNGSIKYNVNPSTATVIIYEKVFDEKTLSIDLLNQDSLDQKYIIESYKSDTSTVVIKGASYKVDQVATVKALVDIKSLVDKDGKPKSELGSTITVSSTLKAYDESGNVIDVEISPAKVDVDLLITSPSKEVPLKIVSSGSVIYNKGISNFAMNDNPNGTITIYGTESALADVEYIPVNINVEGLTETTQFKVELEKPNGIKHMSSNTVTVDVVLSDDISNVEIEDVNISHINLGSGYGVKPIDIDSTTVKLKGVTDIVKSLTAEDVNVYIDLSGKGEGEHEVEIKVTGDDPRIQYQSSVLKMKVKIFKK